MQRSLTPISRRLDQPHTGVVKTRGLVDVTPIAFDFGVGKDYGQVNAIGLSSHDRHTTGGDYVVSHPPTSAVLSTEISLAHCYGQFWHDLQLVRFHDALWPLASITRENVHGARAQRNRSGQEDLSQRGQGSSTSPRLLQQGASAGARHGVYQEVNPPYQLFTRSLLLTTISRGRCHIQHAPWLTSGELVTTSCMNICEVCGVKKTPSPKKFIPTSRLLIPRLEAEARRFQ